MPRCLTILLAALCTAHLAAGETTPADPDLIPEARAVLDYLVSCPGRGIPTGISGFGGGPTAVLHRTGRKPAVFGEDIYGYHTKYGELYRGVVQRQVDAARRWWVDEGGIVSFHYHWGKPGDPDGNAHKNKPKGTKPLDLAKALQPGTDEHLALMEDLRVTGDYLKQLADDHVPVLWRPLHEIDGGWFWWTDEKTPENTAALWRLMFDYYVHERGLHHLIWVYNTAHICHAAKDMSLDEQIAYRKRFYPGDRYVDIASIDTYANHDLGWGLPWEDARGKAADLMRRIAPGKPLAIAEDNAVVDPEALRREQAPWVYCLAWFSDFHGVGWMRQAMNHDYAVDLDRLPDFGRPVAPNARLLTPTPGGQLADGDIEISGLASDRNGDLAQVSVYAARSPWRCWTERPDSDIAEAFPPQTLLGEAVMQVDGSWRLVWKHPAAGFYELVAIAQDRRGARSNSNVVPVSVGLIDLASQRPVTASSSDQFHPAALAVDGDALSAWWSDKSRNGPQWLQVDLGEERTVGGVLVSWWKAYAKDYAVELSDDGKTWRQVAGQKKRRMPNGDSDILRFAPQQARYARLLLNQPAVDWLDYCIYAFGVYERIPE